MTSTATKRAFLPTDESLQHRLLAVLAQHRMATGPQLRTMLNVHRPKLSSALNDLRRKDLTAHITLPSSNRMRAWYLTPDGARITRDWPELRGRPPYPVTSATAASLRTSHTLTVVRTHCAFAADARARGDDHGPLDWTPEVAHQLPDSERLIADALMRYTVSAAGADRSMLRAFVEVDRTTMSAERLASKLIEYARFHDYLPAPAGRRIVQAAQQSLLPTWQRWYAVFPRVLFVLTGASPTTLSNRITDLQAMAAEHPLVASLVRQVPLGAAALEDLEEHGAGAAVWTALDGSGGQRPWTKL
ncbi:replication-relaxation family protein [Streptomyces sp. 8N706]|uniref:replication-relaxation family protein n=1 Tax=Streptomyces sp. 8N706 TaxID=3457416 RepID=UPI003FD43030